MRNASIGSVTLAERDLAACRANGFVDGKLMVAAHDRFEVDCVRVWDWR